MLLLAAAAKVCCVVWRVCYSSNKPNTHKSVSITELTFALFLHISITCVFYIGYLWIILEVLKKKNNCVFIRQNFM